MSKNIEELIHFKEGKMPRVAAVHDICGYGNCSLVVALPVVSLGGVDVLPVPTSVLSAHTHFPSFTFFDTTPTLNEYVENWKELAVDVDGIYTGFLGSTTQIDLIRKLASYYPEAFKVIDPVMGDNGKRYATYTDEMCVEMRKLIPLADVLTPNITEASILLDEEYPGVNISIETAREIAQKLINLGAKHVVLKGIETEDSISNVVLSADGSFEIISYKLHEYKLHGTGDLFASCITAGLFSGHDLIESTKFAAKFVYDSIEFSTTQVGFELRGVNYEPLMYRIVDFCRS